MEEWTGGGGPLGTALLVFAGRLGSHCIPAWSHPAMACAAPTVTEPHCPPDYTDLLTGTCAPAAGEAGGATAPGR